MIKHVHLSDVHLVLEDARRKDGQNTLFVADISDADAVRVLSILTVQDAETLRNSLNEWVVQEKGSSEDSSWVQFPKEQPEPLKTYMVEIRRVGASFMPIYRGIGFLGNNGKFRITGVPKEAIERWDDTYDSVYFKEWK